MSPKGTPREMVFRKTHKNVLVSAPFWLMDSWWKEESLNLNLPLQRKGRQKNRDNSLLMRLCFLGQKTTKPLFVCDNYFLEKVLACLLSHKEKFCTLLYGASSKGFYGPKKKSEWHSLQEVVISYKGPKVLSVCSHLSLRDKYHQLLWKWRWAMYREWTMTDWQS